MQFCSDQGRKFAKITNFEQAGKLCLVWINPMIFITTACTNYTIKTDLNSTKIVGLWLIQSLCIHFFDQTKPLHYHLLLYHLCQVRESSSNKLKVLCSRTSKYSGKQTYHENIRMSGFVSLFSVQRSRNYCSLSKYWVWSDWCHRGNECCNLCDSWPQWPHQWSCVTLLLPCLAVSLISMHWDFQENI